MKGNNTLQVNHATMVEAFQEYMDKRYKPALVVKRISQQPSGTFFVDIEEGARNEIPQEAG